MKKLSKAQQAVVDMLNQYAGSYILYNAWVFKSATIFTTIGEIKLLMSTFNALRDKDIIEKTSEIDRFKKVYKLKQLITSKT